MIILTSNQDNPDIQFTIIIATATRIYREADVCLTQINRQQCKVYVVRYFSLKIKTIKITMK